MRESKKGRKLETNTRTREAWRNKCSLFGSLPCRFSYGRRFAWLVGPCVGLFAVFMKIVFVVGSDYTIVGLCVSELW